MVGVALAAALAAWFFLAPQAVGGRTAYLVVNGNSMEPGLSRGDLVVVRSRSRYEVGDVVAYRNPIGGRTFLHRIVGREDGRFILKGDANPGPDSARPPAADVHGKVWRSVPYAGGAVTWLARPAHAGIVGGLAVLLLFAGGGTAVQVRRRRRRNAFPVVASAPAPRPTGEPARSLLTGRWTAWALLAAACASVAFAAIAVIAYSRPATAEVTRKVPYRQSGAFAYSAPAPTALVYADRTVDTGDPVFLRVVHSVQVRFDYRLVADRELATAGQIGLSAVLSDVSGWSRTVPLQPQSSFQGGVATAGGTLDLGQLTRLVDRVERATGIAHDSYLVTLVPDVSIAGRVAGVQIADRFAPRLRFRLSRLALELDPATAGAQRLAPRETGAVETRMRRTATLSALGPEVSVAFLRRLALFGGLLSFAGLVVLVLLRAFVLRGREHARIEARYGHLLVPMSSSAPDALGPLIDIATIDGLARLAEPGNRPILHSERLGTHSYYVEDGGFLYRYSTGGLAEPEAREDEEAVARLRLLGLKG